MDNSIQKGACCAYHRQQTDIFLHQLKSKTRFSKFSYQRILSYIGHIERKQLDNLDKLVVVGKVDEKRPRGRSPTRWPDTVKEVLGIRVTETLRQAEDRVAWKQLVSSAT